MDREPTGTFMDLSWGSGIMELLSTTEGVIKDGSYSNIHEPAHCTAYYCQYLANCYVLAHQRGRDGCGQDWPDISATQPTYQ